MTVPIGNQTVTAVLATYGAPDRLGVKSKVETQTPITGCSLQPLSTVETLGDIDEVTTHWVLYAPVAVSLNAIDSIITPWDNARYDVDGDPQVWTDFFGTPQHQTVHLRRATG